MSIERPLGHNLPEFLDPLREETVVEELLQELVAGSGREEWADGVVGGDQEPKFFLAEGGELEDGEDLPEEGVSGEGVGDVGLGCVTGLSPVLTRVHPAPDSDPTGDISICWIQSTGLEQSDFLRPEWARVEVEHLSGGLRTRGTGKEGCPLFWGSSFRRMDSIWG